MNCSCHAAQASKENFQKTCYKTFYTTCRPRLYNVADFFIHSQQKVDAELMGHSVNMWWAQPWSGGRCSPWSSTWSNNRPWSRNHAPWCTLSVPSSPCFNSVTYCSVCRAVFECALGDKIVKWKPLNGHYSIDGLILVSKHRAAYIPW